MVKFLKMLSISVREGTATRKYPFESPLVTPEFRGKIEIDPVKCVGCGACTRICPPKALTIGNEGDEIVLKYFEGRCIFCGMCAYVCPQKAITVSKEFELATWELGDLYDEVVHTTVKCRICGKPFTTVKFVKEVEKRIDNKVPEDLLTVCPECRKKLTARKIGSKVVGVSGE